MYLSNAAIHGNIEAMAKMAEVELAAHNYQEAMNWAQIYGHYAPLLPKNFRPSKGYLAGLLARINEHFNSSKLPEIVRDLNVFIENYDADIQAAQKRVQAARSFISAKPSSNRDVTLAVMNSATSSDFADYLVAFKPNGTVANIWLLDSTPNPRLGNLLRSAIVGYTVTPASTDVGADLRYAWVPVVYDDQQYDLKNPDQSKH